MQTGSFGYAKNTIVVMYRLCFKPYTISKQNDTNMNHPEILGKTVLK